MQMKTIKGIPQHRIGALNEEQGERIELGSVTLDGSLPVSLHDQLTDQLRPVAEKAWALHPNNPANKVQ